MPSIIHAGYTPFDLVCNSDHRGLFVDINLSQLLNFNIIPLQLMPILRLQSQIPKRTKRNDFHINKKLQEIQYNIQKNNVVTFERDLNNLAKCISDSMRHAEKKCCNLPQNSLNRWIPHFNKAFQTLHKCHSARNKAQYMVPGKSIVEAIHNYKASQEAFEIALKDYREAKTKDDDFRKLHRQQLVLDTPEENKTPYQNEYDKLLHTESQQKSNKKIKYVLKLEARAGVRCILIPSQCEYNDDYPNFDYRNVDNMSHRI